MQYCIFLDDSCCRHLDFVKQLIHVAVMNICKLLVLFVLVRPKWQRMQLFIKSLRHEMESKRPLAKVSTGVGIIWFADEHTG